MTNERRQFERWVDKVKDNPEFSRELAAIAGNEAEINDRFFRDLSFGTAGLRGVLGLGTNRMNVYTVRRATQGLAEYLLAEAGGSPSAAIAYDSRINSDLFAREAACVLAANGVKVHLYAELMPTPALSYAVRELGCDTGVVITASHNPAQYNGYKAYDNQGCQMGPEEAEQVFAAMEKTDVFDGAKYMPFDEGVQKGLINYIPEEFVQQYISRVIQEALKPEICKTAGLRLVYTPLNGAGNRCVRTALDKLGVNNITIVPEQEHPDGNFPTCPYPNPEMREALKLGVALFEKEGADLLLATDPDADRVAVAVKVDNGVRILTGNEVGVLLLDYIAETRQKNGTMPKNPVAVKSLVSSPLADQVAAHYGVEMRSVLTGFKFIGEVIAGLEKDGEGERFIFGFEESCGYLSSGYVRDKDAINASVLLVELASCCKAKGQTLAHRLDEIYKRHGIYRSVVSSFAFEGADGMKKMAGIMEDLRQNPPSDFAYDAVVRRLDYGNSTCFENGKPVNIQLPGSDVLAYELANGSSIIVRPSGTEPKLKIYYSLVAKTTAEVNALAEKYAEACQKRIGV